MAILCIKVFIPYCCLFFLEWDRKKLCNGIASLERRHREIVSVLSRLDPEVYLQKLQSQLLSLQKANRSLKRDQAKMRQAQSAGEPVPDSSTGGAESYAGREHEEIEMVAVQQGET